MTDISILSFFSGTMFYSTRQSSRRLLLLFRPILTRTFLPVNLSARKVEKCRKRAALRSPHRAAQNSSFVKSKPSLEKRLSGKLIPSRFPFRRGAFPPLRRPQTFFPNRGHRGNDPHSALRGRFVLRSQVGLDCSAPCAPP